MRIAKGSGLWIATPMILGMLFLVPALLTNASILINATVFALAVIFFAIAIFLYIFFRDPERRIGNGIVSPADGVVVCIMETKCWNVIKIFMNLHNVHVNRCPIDGKVLNIEEFGGGFAPAYKKEADRNRRTETTLETDIGKVRVVQVAGVFVRRIVPYIHRGQYLSRGERIGIVRLGSRVNLYLPKRNVRITVRQGAKVMAGSTTVAVVDNV